MSEESGYRKINKQMKFEFLRKVLGQGLTIFEVSLYWDRPPNRSASTTLRPKQSSSSTNTSTRATAASNSMPLRSHSPPNALSSDCFSPKTPIQIFQSSPTTDSRNGSLGRKSRPAILLWLISETKGSLTSVRIWRESTTKWRKKAVRTASSTSLKAKAMRSRKKCKGRAEGRGLHDEEFILFKVENCSS